MSLVVDASVIVKWVFDEVDSDAAGALFAQGGLTAPSLWIVEVSNALWLRVKREEISASQAVARLEQLRIAPLQTSPIELDAEQALILAAKLKHPVYDCVYLAAAVRQDIQVVTADRRFARAVEKTDLAGRIRLLGL